jgi:hypothetical protein
MNQTELERYERELGAILGVWAAGSIIKGAAIAGLNIAGSDTAGSGQYTGRREWMRFGRQTAVWGAINAIIAGAGAIGRSRRGELTDEEATAKARSLHRLLLINAAADVAYSGVGVYLAMSPRRSRGDGVAVIIQGGFLLVLDTVYARRLGAARRAATSDPVAPVQGQRTQGAGMARGKPKNSDSGTERSLESQL